MPSDIHAMGDGKESCILEEAGSNHESRIDPFMLVGAYLASPASHRSFVAQSRMQQVSKIASRSSVRPFLRVSILVVQITNTAPSRRRFNSLDTQSQAAMDEEAHLSFFLEWYDPQADQLKPYILHFYGDQTLELIERKTRRVFLKRIRIPTVSLSDLFVGASISIYSRQLTILEAANEYTKTQLQQQASKATFVVTPKGYRFMGKIISAIEHSATDHDALLLVNVVMVQLESSHVATLAKHFMPQASSMQQLLTKDVSVLIEVKLSTPNALEDAKAKLDATKLSEFVLVGECGIDRLIPSSAPCPTTAVLDNCSLCLMRPRMLREKHVGEILDEILSAGFEVSALKMFHFKMDDANEFFSVYKGIYRQYHEVLKYMTSAPSIALEIRGDDAVRNFRELCGPHDVQVARVLRPKSLRARFGKSNLHNALHCTDCPEDGVLETQFIFSTLS